MLRVVLGAVPLTVGRRVQWWVEAVEVVRAVAAVAKQQVAAAAAAEAKVVVGVGGV